MFSAQWNLLWSEDVIESELQIPDLPLLASFKQILEDSDYPRSPLLDILESTASQIHFADFLATLSLQSWERWLIARKLQEVLNEIISAKWELKSLTNKNEAKGLYRSIEDWELLDDLSDDFFLWLEWFTSKSDIQKSKQILMNVLIDLAETVYKYFSLKPNSIAAQSSDSSSQASDLL